MLFLILAGDYLHARGRLPKPTADGVTFWSNMYIPIGLAGGGMLRDYAIVATAWGARLGEMKKTGLAGVLSLFVGIFSAYITGVAMALAYGYSDPVSLATIGAGAVTFIVGSVTGAALGASSPVIAISIAAGVIKSVLVMILTPLTAPFIGLNNPHAAMIYGCLLRPSVCFLATKAIFG